MCSSPRIRLTPGGTLTLKSEKSVRSGHWKQRFWICRTDGSLFMGMGRRDLASSGGQILKPIPPGVRFAVRGEGRFSVRDVVERATVVQHGAARPDGFEFQAWLDLLSFVHHLAVGDQHAMRRVL